MIKVPNYSVQAQQYRVLAAAQEQGEPGMLQYLSRRELGEVARHLGRTNDKHISYSLLWWAFSQACRYDQRRNTDISNAVDALRRRYGTTAQRLYRARALAIIEATLLIMESTGDRTCNQLH
jgi:hypothetical protein